MKILVDMNLSPRWANYLTAAGIHAVHWSTIGNANAPDLEIMVFSKTNNYIVLTHDLDFSAILATTHGNKPSVVQVRSDEINTAVIGQLVVDALHQMATELDEGALLTIDPARTRLRMLPLRSP